MSKYAGGEPINTDSKFSEEDIQTYDPSMYEEYEDQYDPNTCAANSHQLRRQSGGVSRNRAKPDEEFLKRTTAVLGVGEEEVKELFSAKPLKAVRTNRFGHSSETSADERAQLLLGDLEASGVAARELHWFKGAFLFDAEDMDVVQQTDSVQRGRGFVQSPASYLPVIALNAISGESIMDMCAAPGGKSALVADFISGSARIIANELKARRFEKMRSVLGSLGVHDIDLVMHDAKHLARLYGQDSFERVLADVECSTEAGVNFKSKSPLKGWSMNRVERSAQLQRQIIRVGYDMLKPGGTLIYSTCSLAPEENELVVASLLDTRKGVIVQPIEFEAEKRVQPIRRWEGKRITPEATEGVLRIKPNDYMEPFTVVSIRKSTDDKELNELMHLPLDLDRRARSRE
jgi:16S rRNA C967 or C1407 C5-methylase (RsmB/RsmF family)